MAGHDETQHVSHHQRGMTSSPHRRTLIRSVYLTALLQLLLALAIGIIGMFASSRNCTLSVAWIYFFNAMWFVVTSSIGLSPTRRGTMSLDLKHFSKTMKWFRALCAVGLPFVCAFMTVEIIGLVKETEPTPTDEAISCMALHLMVLGVGFLSLLVTIAAIVTSSRVISVFRKLQREGRTSFAPEFDIDTVSGRLGQTNFGMIPDDIFRLPPYSLDADLPPSYEDVISGKSERTQPNAAESAGHSSSSSSSTPS